MTSNDIEADAEREAIKIMVRVGYPNFDEMNQTQQIFVQSQCGMMLFALREAGYNITINEHSHMRRLMDETDRLRAEVEQWKDETNYYQADARKLRAALKAIERRTHPATRTFDGIVKDMDLANDLARAALEETK